MIQFIRLLNIFDVSCVQYTVLCRGGAVVEGHVLLAIRSGWQCVCASSLESDVRACVACGSRWVTVERISRGSNVGYLWCRCSRGVGVWGYEMSMK